MDGGRAKGGGGGRDRRAEKTSRALILASDIWDRREAAMSGVTLWRREVTAALERDSWDMLEGAKGAPLLDAASDRARTMGWHWMREAT